MLIKRPIYNQKLNCVAFEILSHQKMIQSEENTNMLYDLIKNADTQLPLFIPFALSSKLEQFEAPIDNPIILKLNADEIETIYPLQQLEDSMFSIALLINTPQQLAFLNCAEYIGLTEQLMEGADLTKVVNFSKAKERKVIAYGLAKPLSFDKCKAMTMDYYCGDFLFKPVETDLKDIAANKLNLLHLIQGLQKEECDFNAIAAIIQNDPLLSFQLLKVANSAGFSGYQAIDSIDQAITRLGLVNLKNWVMVLSMKNISDKPIEILESGLIRAHMAEAIAKKRSDIMPQSAYTAGLLSILDCLLNKPMSELVDQITLGDDIKNALLTHTGALGELLATIISYEEGNWEKVPEQHIKDLDLSKVYIDCLSLVSQGTKAMRH